MTTTRILSRSRRRRATFSLFGRTRQCAVPLAQWRFEEAVMEAVPGDASRDALAAARELDPDQEAEIQNIVARLRRDARANQRLLERHPGDELDLLIEEAVRALWAESRVTAFVPLLAMRRVHEMLGLADPASDGAASRREA